MKLTDFGATGGIGGCVVRQALDAGHTVAAVLRNPDRLTVSRLPLDVVIAADLNDVDAVLPALLGSDAAISAIGPRSRKDGPVAASTMHGILRALDVSGVRRFLTVSAAPVDERPTPVGPAPDAGRTRA